MRDGGEGRGGNERRRGNKELACVHQLKKCEWDEESEGVSEGNRKFVGWWVGEEGRRG